MASPISADTYGGEVPCQPSYGKDKCDKPDILLDKKVADPTTVGMKGATPSNYQDNFGFNSEKYVPGQQVPFQISVTNTGNKTLKDIKVEDTLPKDILYVSSVGKYDAATHKVSFTIESLAPNEKKTIELIGQVVASDKFPSDQTVICSIVNNASATVENVTSSDKSEICVKKESVGGPKIDKKVYPAPKAKKTPPTGPEAIALLPIIGGAISGYMLRRKTNNL